MLLQISDHARLLHLKHLPLHRDTTVSDSAQTHSIAYKQHLELTTGNREYTLSWIPRVLLMLSLCLGTAMDLDQKAAKANVKPYILMFLIGVLERL